jgi:hypothetical protein
MYRQKDCVACRCGHNSFKPFSLLLFILFYFFFGSSHLVVVARNTKLELKAIEPNFDRQFRLGLRWINTQHKALLCLEKWR